MTYFSVHLTVEVTDPKALWDRTVQHLIDCNSIETAADAKASIGTRRRPDVANCLRLLLDRNENLAGAAVADSTAEEDAEQ